MTEAKTAAKTENTKRQKVAILGSGSAALTTAYELSSQPGWQNNFDITLYQMGWRLGGKCATARGPNARIEEHGIHGFLGCADGRRLLPQLDATQLCLHGRVCLAV